MAQLSNSRLCDALASAKVTDRGFKRKGDDMAYVSTRDELVARMVRAGELEISGESQEETDSYFDTENFAFHGPDGFDSDYAGLTEYFQSIRAAFEDRTIRRGIIVAEGDRIACQTWIEGTFTAPFTHSPVGKLEPNGARVVWDLINMFKFDDRGRLVEEIVRTDNRSFLRHSAPKEPDGPDRRRRPFREVFSAATSPSAQGSEPAASVCSSATEVSAASSQSG